MSSICNTNHCALNTDYYLTRPLELVNPDAHISKTYLPNFVSTERRNAPSLPVFRAEVVKTPETKRTIFQNEIFLASAAGVPQTLTFPRENCPDGARCDVCAAHMRMHAGEITRNINSVGWSGSCKIATRYSRARVRSPVSMHTRPLSALVLAHRSIYSAREVSWPFYWDRAISNGHYRPACGSMYICKWNGQLRELGLCLCADRLLRAAA